MFNFITVVFKDELPLLKVQAHSLDLYILPKDISQITIVVNDNESTVDPAWWGQHSSKVIVKNYNLDSSIPGWESQQICKLLAAGDSNTTWSLVLDAKTWFVKQFESAKLFGQNGKPWVGSVPGKPGVFVQARAFVEQLYNIQMPKILGPNGVPYMFHTETVKELINSFDDFIGFFRNNVKGPNFLTEFFLYSGFLIKKYGSLEELYNTNHTYLYPTNLADNEDFNDVFAKIRRHPGSILTASIHRRAYSKLTQDQLNLWIDFLVERHLIKDKFTALELLNTYIK